jgi:glyoxylase-like metal-dependent hydrolase (beta-lactamase superfamily II)
VILLKKVVNNVYIVKPFDPNTPDCCVYMVDTRSEDGLVLIDVGTNFEPIQNIEKEGFALKNVKHCLITHGHFDHYGACFKLKEYNKDIKFYAHELDAEAIEQETTNPNITQLYAEYKYERIKITNKLKADNELLNFGNLEFRCIHIPGHTPGSVAYLLDLEGKNILFAGDLPGIAINYQGGNLEAYLKSMQKLLNLDIDISCEGHEDLIFPAERLKKYIKGYMKLNEKLNIVVLENPSDIESLLELAKVSKELAFYENVLDFSNYVLEIAPDNKLAKNLIREAEKHNPAKINWIKGLIERASESRN